MASPRDLDPKFRDEKRESVEDTERDVTADELKREESEDETPMLVHRQRIVQPDGTVTEKVHGPMPQSDWAAYEKENNL
jgi:hypothetical protein